MTSRTQIVKPLYEEYPASNKLLDYISEHDIQERIYGVTSREGKVFEMHINRLLEGEFKGRLEVFITDEDYYEIVEAGEYHFDDWDDALKYGETIITNHIKALQTGKVYQTRPINGSPYI